MASVGKAGRVLIIVQNLPVPFDRRVWLEATSLTRAGYLVSVICPKAKGWNRGFETLEGVDIYRYALPIDAQGPLGFMIEFAWCFLRTSMLSFRVALWGRGFDVIHACNPPETYWLLGRFYHLFGKKFLFDHHDLSPEMYVAKFGRDSGFLLRMLKWLEKCTFRSADMVITTNESHKSIAMERGGVPADRIYVVRSGPDVARLTRYPADAKWKCGKPYLLAYLGEICKQDGVDHLIRAIKFLDEHQNRDDFHCVIVGGGPHQASIKSYAEELGVDHICTFTGRVSDEDLCRILSSADVAIDPDPKNDWSDKSTMNKIMEYMYFGLPIVAYDLTEGRYSAQGAAVYVEPNCEAALAEGIDQLLDDREKREVMSDYGMRRLRDHLAWEHSEPRLLAAYGRICPATPGNAVAHEHQKSTSTAGLHEDNLDLQPNNA